MPEQEILKEIENAIQNPQLYSASDAKNKLRAAFDALVSQTFAGIYGEEPRSRMNARQKLNSSKKEDHPDDWQTILALRDALRISEQTLHSREYVEHALKIEGFIKKQLKDLFDAIK